MERSFIALAILFLVTAFNAYASVPSKSQTPAGQVLPPLIESPLETAFRGVMRSVGQQELSDKAAELYRTGKYAEALPLAQKALELTEKTLGRDHPDVATVRIGLGYLYAAVGDYSKAEELMKQALAIKEAVLGPDHPQVAIALSYLSELYRHMGAYEKAKPLMIRAIKISEQAEGPAHLQLAFDLSHLASLNQDMGDYSQAIVLKKQAVSLLENSLGQQHPYVADQLNALGWVYLDMGDYAKATSSFQQAVVILEHSVGQDHPYIADSLLGLASIYRNIRDYKRAVPLYERILAIRGKIFGPDHPEAATIFNELAIAFDLAGDYAKGVPFNQRALAIREKAFGSDHPAVATSLNNIAVEYVYMGEYEKAEPLHQRALSIREKSFGLEHPNVAVSLNNLGFIYEHARAYSKAESLYQRALTINENALGPMHPRVMDNLDTLAFLAASEQDYRSSIGFFKRAFLIQEQQIQNIFSFTTEEQKLQFIQTISATYYAFLSLIHQHLSTDQESIRNGLEVVFRRKGIVFEAQSKVRQSLQGRLSETARNDFSLLATLQSQLARLLLNKPENMSLDTYRGKIIVLRQQIEAAEQRLAKESALVAKELQQRTISVEAAAKALPKNSALVEFVKIQDYDFPTKKWVGTGRYLAFVLNATGNVTLVDLGDANALETTARRMLSDIHVSLENRGIQISKLSTDINSKQSLKYFSDLYSQLWAPLDKSLGPADTVVLSPDGLLNVVPFVALLDGEGRYLAERYKLAYVSSGREMIALDTVAFKQGLDLILVANPAFEKQQVIQSMVASVRSRDFRGTFSPLPGTEREAKEIPSLVSGKDERKLVLEGDKATEGAVKSVHSPRILHLATHGFFLQEEEISPCSETRGVAVVKNENYGKMAQCEKTRGVTVVKKENPTPPMRYENPLVRSGLAFAGANNASEITEGDDGILTALEITGMDLYGTDLVVLSACDTGVGEVKTGEGVFGLRRAFALAGAKNLMMSLWPVSDEITADQMKAFYQNLQKYLPAEALRQAQLNTIRELKAKDGFASPALWAPFILQGARSFGQ